MVILCDSSLVSWALILSTLSIVICRFTQIYTHVNMNKRKALLSSKHPRRKMDLEG